MWLRVILLVLAIAWSASMAYRIGSGLISSVKLARFGYGDPQRRVSLYRQPATFLFGTALYFAMLVAMLLVFGFALVALARIIV